VQLPFVSFADTKPRLLAKANKLIVGFEGPADTLVHHGEAIVCKSLIVHRATLAKKSTLAQNVHDWRGREGPELTRFSPSRNLGGRPVPKNWAAPLFSPSTVSRAKQSAAGYASLPIGAGALGTSERNVRFGHLVVESPRYHES